MIVVKFQYARLRDVLIYGTKPPMKILNTKEASEILKVDTSRVRRLILCGRLPAQKIGRDWAILEKDLKLVADRKPGRPPAKKKRRSKKPGSTQGDNT